MSGKSSHNWLQRQWTRLMKLRQNELGILSINRRNLHYIYPNNHRRDFPLADNKLTLKQYFADSDIPMAQTLSSYGYFYELRNLAQDLHSHPEFVIKPASGRGGGGILVVKEKTDGGWRNMSGRLITLEDIRKHIADIIFGVYSFSLNDQAIIEQRIHQHASIDKISPNGLADVRIILYRDKPVMHMIRIATKDSNGTANLHQGAIGAAVDWETGTTFHASRHGHSLDTHPDTGVSLLNIQLPHWQRIQELAIKIAHSVPLKYLGIDIALGQTSPYLLEINARPGIEIQNVNNRGLRQCLENLTQPGGHQ